MTVITVIAVATTITYNGQVLYPYYCSKTWLCDWVTEQVWRTYCKKPKRPCTTVR